MPPLVRTASVSKPRNRIFIGITIFNIIMFSLMFFCLLISSMLCAFDTQQFNNLSRNVCPATVFSIQPIVLCCMFSVFVLLEICMAVMVVFLSLCGCVMSSFLLETIRPISGISLNFGSVYQVELRRIRFNLETCSPIFEARCCPSSPARELSLFNATAARKDGAEPGKGPKPKEDICNNKFITPMDCPEGFGDTVSKVMRLRYNPTAVVMFILFFYQIAVAVLEGVAIYYFDEVVTVSSTVATAAKVQPLSESNI